MERKNRYWVTFSTSWARFSYHGFLFFIQGFVDSRRAISQVELCLYFCIQSRKTEMEVIFTIIVLMISQLLKTVLHLDLLLYCWVRLIWGFRLFAQNLKQMRVYLSAILDCLFSWALPLAPTIESWTVLGFLSLIVPEFFCSAVYRLSKYVGSLLWSQILCQSCLCITLWQKN